MNMVNEFICGKCNLCYKLSIHCLWIITPQNDQWPTRDQIIAKSEPNGDVKIKRMYEGGWVGYLKYVGRWESHQDSNLGDYYLCSSLCPLNAHLDIVGGDWTLF